MKFYKMHGAGNDFIIIEGSVKKDYSNLAYEMCQRHFSVGADGLMVIQKKDEISVYMRYYNADGSIGEMCGNGARCLAMYAYTHNFVASKSFSLFTLSGEIEAEIIDTTNVKIAMGKPEYNSLFERYFFDEVISVKDQLFRASYILMGVPHVVIEFDDLDKRKLLEYGPTIEKNIIFSKGANVNFVKIVDRNNVSIDTWERGAGNTLACGTGALAVGFCLCKLGKVDRNINISTSGGELKVIINEDEQVFLEGPAVIVFEGNFEEERNDK